MPADRHAAARQPEVARRAAIPPEAPASLKNAAPAIHNKPVSPDPAPSPAADPGKPLSVPKNTTSGARAASTNAKYEKHGPKYVENRIERRAAEMV